MQKFGVSKILSNSWMLTKAAFSYSFNGKAEFFLQKSFCADFLLKNHFLMVFYFDEEKVKKNSIYWK